MCGFYVLIIVLSACIMLREVRHDSSLSWLLIHTEDLKGDTHLAQKMVAWKSIISVAEIFHGNIPDIQHVV